MWCMDRPQVAAAKFKKLSKHAIDWGMLTYQTSHNRQVFHSLLRHIYHLPSHNKVGKKELR